MADSIPSLRRIVNTLQEEIRQLRNMPEKIVKVQQVTPPEVVEKIVEVIKIVELPAKVITVYCENPDQSATIKSLQEEVCQLRFRLGSLENQGQKDPQ